MTEFPKQWKNPLASATRLLAMKRPDVFICINNRNNEGLSKMLGMTKPQINLENYWECVVKPFISSEWEAQGKNSTIGQEYYPFRIALLDALFYKDDFNQEK